MVQTLVSSGLTTMVQTMTETTPGGWQVIDREAGVLTYKYTFTKNGTANAFAARMPGGKMLVLSPPCNIDEGVFADLLEFGDVGAVVATNGFHHMGQAEWKARFPNARFFAPSKAIARIAKKNPDAGELEPLSELQPMLNDEVGVGEAPATKCGETWGWARIDGGYAWFGSDIIANMPSLPPKFPVRMMFKLTGSAPGYRLFGLALMAIIKNKKVALAAFREALHAHPPTVVVPAHGDINASPDVAAKTDELLAAAL